MGTGLPTRRRHPRIAQPADLGFVAREVEAAADELGISRATLYRMVRLYRVGGTVSSLSAISRPAEEIEIALARTLKR